MGQSFSLTSQTKKTARLERELSEAKGKCKTTDKVVVGLERDLKQVTEERDELQKLEKIATILQERNADLERRIAALSDERNTPASKRECENCEKRIAKLKEEADAISRKLVASTNHSTPAPAETSRTIAYLRQRMEYMERDVRRRRESIKRMMAFAFQDFSLTTYKSSWSLRNIKMSRFSHGTQAILVIEKFEYKALLVARYKDRYARHLKGTILDTNKRNELDIIVEGRTRTVCNAEKLWAAIVKDWNVPRNMQKPGSADNKPVITDRFRAVTTQRKNEREKREREREMERIGEREIEGRGVKKTRR